MTVDTRDEWIVIDIRRPVASLREALGDAASCPSQAEACALLGLGKQALASREQRGGSVQVGVLEKMAAGYGLELEIRVRRR